jgi:hypothetical protein
VNVGDLVQYDEWLSYTLTGVVIRDHSPQRPPHVGRVVDVLWSDGEIDEANTNDLVLLSESR